MASKDVGGSWSTRVGFIMAALGAMIGSGNIWRFPREVAMNGGGVFIIPYTIALVTVAVPLLIAEGIIGRETNNGPILGFAKFFGRKYSWLGGWLVWVNTAIMFYYAIVAGWALYYFVIGFTGTYAHYTPGMGQTIWNSMIHHVWKPLLFGFIVWVFTWLALVKGTRGIERVTQVMVPLLFVFLAIVAIRALTMPGAAAGLKYLYHGDVAKLYSSETWIQAYSQILWSTGAGWGIFLTYAAFLKKKDDVNLNSHITGWGNCSASQLAALAVIPTIAALAPLIGKSAMDIYQAGNTGMTFIWLTDLLAKLPGGVVIGPLFYLALFFAAFTSQIAIAEVPIKAVEDFGVSTKRAVTYVTIAGFIFGIPAAVSIKWLNNQDWVWGVGLLISATIIALLMLKKGLSKAREMANEGSDIKIGKWWDILLGYVTPVSIVAILIAWIWRSIKWYPHTWWKITETYSPGTTLAQWVVAAIVIYLVIQVGLGRKIERHIKTEG